MTAIRPEGVSVFSKAMKIASITQPSSNVTIRHGQFHGNSLNRKNTSQATPM